MSDQLKNWEVTLYAQGTAKLTVQAGSLSR